MKKVDLLIVTSQPVPYGLASTNRLLCYADGLAKKKDVVIITLSGPYDNPQFQIPQIGKLENVAYRYLGQTYLSKKSNTIVRALNRLWRHLKLIKLLLIDYKARTILVLSRDNILSILLWIISSLKGIKLYRETSETPEYIVNKLKRYISTNINRLYSGLIVISDGMKNYYRKILSDDKFFILPVLVDMDAFINYQNVEKKKYFFYCSGANLERDGFLDGLHAFLEFNKKYPEYELQVATSLNMQDPYHQKAAEIMNDNTHCVKYLGKLPSFEIPQKLMQATALMITPHRNYLTRGFPTKLGEYLASGTPVICSSIDDLVTQLNHDCVYMVAPNFPQEIVSAMENIVNHPEKAKETGEKGRQFAINRFCIDSYVDELISFLKI